MSNLKCPICGEILQKYGEVDPDTGTSIVLGASCPQCGIRDSDIKLWQALINTKKKLDIAVDALKKIDETRSGVKENLHATNGRTLNAGNGFCWTTIDDIHNALEQITALEQKDK